MGRPGEISWDAERWLERFREASRRRDRRALRALRVEVWRTTVEAVRERGYRCGDLEVDLDPDGHYGELRSGTTFHASGDALAVPPERRGAYATQVEVRNADTLDVARELAAEGETPAVLNMASPRNPGGGVQHGAGAQEENVFRRTNLFHSLFQFVDYGREYGVPPDPAGHRYPIPRESGGLYSPPATVFRSSEATGYAFLIEPSRAAFLTVPAIPDPDVEKGPRDGRVWMTAPHAEATRRKLRALLRIAAHHGSAELVLSAFGCGAFRNPPQHVARLFRETLAEPELAGAFRRVVFAILDDPNALRPESPEGNLAPFARELGGREKAS